MSIVLSMIVLLSMVLAACTSPATTEAPVVDEPTEEVVVEEPTEEVTEEPAAPAFEGVTVQILACLF